MAKSRAHAKGSSGAAPLARCELCRSEDPQAVMRHRVRAFDDDDALRRHLVEQFPDAAEYSIDASVADARKFRERWRPELTPQQSAPATFLKLVRLRGRISA